MIPFEDVVPFEGGNDCDGLDDGNVNNCVATVGVLNNVKNCEVDSKVIRKFTCPNCKKEIVNLPRHMQKIHGWSLPSSKAVVGQFGLRKSTSKNSRHLSKICPFPGCHKVLKNTLPKHLVVVHNVVRGSEEQKSLVRKAKCHMQPSTDAPQLDSPCKDFGVSHHPQSKCTSDRYTVKANPCIADIIDPSAHVQQQEQEGYVYETRKKQLVQYNDGDSNSEENNDSDDDYNPLSDDEDFGEAMLETFSQFSKYMRGPDRKVKGGSVSNTMSNVRRIFDLLDVTDLPHFFDNFVDLVRDKYLGGYCIQREIKASSIRTYITSLQEFFTFLLAYEVNIKGIKHSTIISSKAKCELWKKKYKSEAREQRQQRRAIESENLITTEQVRLYEKCENACNAREIFNRLLVSDFELSCSDFVCIRDHLIILCSFFTSNRSGVQSNMTMEEFRNAVISPDNIEISVEKHKTADDYGNAGNIIPHRV